VSLGPDAVLAVQLPEDPLAGSDLMDLVTSTRTAGSDDLVAVVATAAHRTIL